MFWLLLVLHSCFSCQTFMTCSECISEKQNCVFVEDSDSNFLCVPKAKRYNKVRRIFRTKERCQILKQKLQEMNIDTLPSTLPSTTHGTATTSVLTQNIFALRSQNKTGVKLPLTVEKHDDDSLQNNTGKALIQKKFR